MTMCSSGRTVGTDTYFGLIPRINHKNASITNNENDLQKNLF